jgi:hypothetical protein
MGKKADSGKEKSSVPEPKKEEEESRKNVKASQEEAESAQGALSRLRPQSRRPIFFCLYVAFCAWLVGTYDACSVTGKKRDCGYAGISPTECITTACFTKGGGEMKKKTVKIERKDGALGLTVGESSRDVNWLTVTAVTAGAVAEYNAQAAAEDRVLVGDSIAKVSGSSGPKKMKKALAETGKTIELELRRSRLPWYFKWAGTNDKNPGLLEKVVTSPGFEKWSRSASYIGGGGLLCWLLSGYPPASLPIYYFSLSGATAFALVRCCHDEDVGAGVPHCYKGNTPKVEDAVKEAAAKTRSFLGKIYTDIAEDPKKYFVSFFGFKI